MFRPLTELGIRPTACLAWLFITPAALGGVAWQLGIPITGAALLAGATFVGQFLFSLQLARTLSGTVVEPLLQMQQSLRRPRTDPIEPPDPATSSLLQDLHNAVEVVSSQVADRARESHAQMLSLEQAFTRVHSILQSLSEGVIVIDRHGGLLMLNDMARELLADVPALAKGKPLVEAMPDGDLRDAIAEGIGAVNQQPQQAYRSRDIRCRDRHFDVAIVGVRTGLAGASLDKAIVLIDVTKNHEVARLKDRFLSAVSHELRTPLTNVLSYSDILSSTDHTSANSEAADFLGIIQTEANRMARLVDDLMEYSALEAGQVALHESEQVVWPVIEASLQAAQPRAMQARVELFGENLCKHEVRVKIDPTKLGSALSRILDNALKFTPPDSQIRVRLAVVADEAIISVDDCGDGVPPEQQRTIFDRFSQVGDILTDKPSGSGLGLPIVEHLVRKMHGSISCARSDLGGASFRICLPCLAPAALP